ncbi:MAG TPA: hypothetical protein VGI50_04040 [Solirubrobacteraceae bacterium]|jgi:hypothetical protein
MATLQRNPDPRPRLPTRLGKLGAALVAIAVTILFLAAPGAHHSVLANSTTHTSVSPPPIQHRHTGGCHAVLDPLTGQMHGGCPPN